MSPPSSSSLWGTIRLADNQAYNAVEPHMKDAQVVSRCTLANVYPFVRAAINAQFEFGTGCADQPPSAAECKFDESWVKRYFPDPEKLPLRPFNMYEVDLTSISSVGLQGSIKVKVGWYNHDNELCKTPSWEEQNLPIPQDREWPPTTVDGFREYQVRLTQQYARYGYNPVALEV